MQIYKSSVTLREGTLKTYETGKVASFYYKSGDKGLLVMVNTTDEPLTVKAPIERAGDNVKNLMTGEVTTLPIALTLEPYQYYIWEKE